MGEMEPIGAVGVQFQESRGNDVVVEVDGLAAYVPFPLEDAARLVGDDEVVFDQLAIEDVAGIREEGEPAGHGLDSADSSTRAVAMIVVNFASDSCRGDLLVALYGTVLLLSSEA